MSPHTSSSRHFKQIDADVRQVRDEVQYGMSKETYCVRCGKPTTESAFETIWLFVRFLLVVIRIGVPMVATMVYFRLWCSVIDATEAERRN